MRCTSWVITFLKTVSAEGCEITQHSQNGHFFLVLPFILSFPQTFLFVLFLSFKLYQVLTSIQTTQLLMIDIANVRLHFYGTCRDIASCYFCKFDNCSDFPTNGRTVQVSDVARKLSTHLSVNSESDSS